MENENNKTLLTILPSWFIIIILTEEVPKSIPKKFINNPPL